MSKSTHLKLALPLVQFFQIARSYSIRYLSYLKQKSHPSHLLEQLQITLSKILNQNQAKQVILSRLLSLQLKGDYHQVIALTLLQDLAKWSRQCYEQLIEDDNQKGVLDAIVDHSTKLLNSQQQFHTIVPKQNDLLRELLIMPHVINHQSIQNYRTFYRKLKDVKEFHPQAVKESQKNMFLRTIEESVQISAEFKSLKTLEFIFYNIFAQLQVLQQTHQFITSRLKIVKKIIRNFWFFHDVIIYKSSFLVMKFSQFILALPNLFNSVLNLYEDLMPVLIERLSPAPLIIFNHLILNNIRKIIQEKTSNYLSLQILLNALSQIFKSPFIQYFMKNYDANFMQESLCQNSLNLLFQFVQNRANQKKYEYEIFKKYLKKATQNIRMYLNEQQTHVIQPSEKLIKFYQVKRKQYLEIVQDMNEKPKKIFKKLESISNKDIKQQIIKKYVRIAKKSVHLENKKMIDIFASNNATSQELFSQYVNLLFTNLSKDVNLQQFLRFFSSNFFLNGQSQQILRVLDKITILFYNHQLLSNKTLKNSDSTYTFANAIILLNTDLHNPQNEQKMSVQSFYKMCRRINNGQDLPSQMLNSTYTNIKKNKINTFRQKSSMFGISPSNFVQICNKQEENKLQFYDLEMRMLTEQKFYHFWIYDLLVGIIDERETMKLEQLIQRFVYDDNSYQCEVIQLVRKLSKKKPHIPLHALEKILQYANFKNTKTTQKTISYLWLSVNLVQNFSNLLPTNVICQLLILTWRMRSQIKDDMYLRQKAQIKRVKKMINQYHKRQNKKSIMDMFSSFLSSKDEEAQGEFIEQFNMSQTNIKKMNHKILTQKVLQVLIKSGSSNSGSKANHRSKAIQFFIGYLKNDQQKLFEQFLSLLYLIFHLLYRFDNNSNSNKSIHTQTNSPTQVCQSATFSPVKRKISLSSSLNLSTQIKKNENSFSNLQFQETIQDLLYELLGLKQSSITKRIQNLKKKDVKKYQILQSYGQFWVLKILISKISEQNVKNHRNYLNKQINLKEQLRRDNPPDQKQKNEQAPNKNKQDNLLYLLNKSIEYIQKTNKQIYLDLVYDFQQKAKQIFSFSTTKSSPKIVQNKLVLQIHEVKQKQIKINQENVSGSESVQFRQQVGKNSQNQKQINEIERDLSAQTQIKDAHKNQTKQQKDQPQNLKNQSPQNFLGNSTIIKPSQQTAQELSQQQIMIEKFIFSYKKVILEFYVNCQRIVGKQDMNRNKEWRWLIQLQKMIKDVMESYEEKIINKKQQQDKKTCQSNKKTESILEPPEVQQKQMQNQLQLNKVQVVSQKNNSPKLSSQLNEYESQQNQGQKQQHQADSQTNSLRQSVQLTEKENSLNEKVSQPSQLKQDVQQSSATLKTEQMGKSQDVKATLIPAFVEKQQVKTQNRKGKQQNGLQNMTKQLELTNQQNSQKDVEKQHVDSNQNQRQQLLQMMKQEEEELRKLQELYANNPTSSEILGVPYYML